MNRKYRDSIVVICILLGVFVDYVTKMWANTSLRDTPITLVPDFLSLSLVKNSGIAFGVALPGIFLLTPLLIGIIVYHFVSVERPKNNRYLDIGFALILSGAIGNGWERLIYREVTDFIFVHGFSVFNIADAAINIGVVVIIIGYILEKKHARSQAK